MIAEVLGLACFGATMYLKAKSKVPKDVRAEWQNLDAREKAEYLSEGFNSCAENHVEDVKRTFRKELKGWNDDQLIQTLSKVECSDWRYDLIKNEISRRNK